MTLSHVLGICVSLALDQELAFLSLMLKYEKKYLKLTYESAIVGALRNGNPIPSFVGRLKSSLKRPALPSLSLIDITLSFSRLRMTMTL
jgi:hypothetical protein